jgi:hypothetical protein
MIFSQISKGNKIDHFETIRMAKDGQRIPISVSISPILSRSGKIIGASKIARDISERKRAAEKQGYLRLSSIHLTILSLVKPWVALSPVGTRLL